MATSEVIEASRPEPTSERPRRRLVRGDGRPPYDGEELQRFFTLGPEDVAFVAGTRSDRNRLALALLLTWARAERKLVSDPATLPREVVATVPSAPAHPRGSRWLSPPARDSQRPRDQGLPRAATRRRSATQCCLPS